MIGGQTEIKVGEFEKSSGIAEWLAARSRQWADGSCRAEKYERRKKAITSVRKLVVKRKENQKRFGYSLRGSG